MRTSLKGSLAVLAAVFTFQSCNCAGPSGPDGGTDTGGGTAAAGGGAANGGGTAAGGGTEDGGSDGGSQLGLVIDGPLVPRTSESRSHTAFTVRLAAAPSAPVALPVVSGDSSEGEVSPASLTFTSANWNAPQVVTVTGVDDATADGDQSYTVNLGPSTSSDSAGQGFHASVALTNLDDETAGFTVSTVSGDVSEAGGQATFTVALKSPPSADVLLALQSDNAAEGTIAPAALTFTTMNWNAPQTVTVTGVDDAIADGTQTFTISFTSRTSADAAYAAAPLPAPVQLRNLDNETAGILVSAISGPTREDGQAATFTVALTTRPSAEVIVRFASDRPTEGVTGVTSLTFTSANWNSLQTVTVTGVDDALVDGSQPYNIVFSNSLSADAAYVRLRPANIPVLNIDNDTAGFTVSLVSGNTSEAGGTATFTVALNTQPGSNVQVNFASSDATEGVTSTRSLTFTSLNWNAPQSVTVTGVDDTTADGNQAYTIVFSAAVSADAAYTALVPLPVSVTNTDNDTAGFTVSVISRDTGGKPAERHLHHRVEYAAFRRCRAPFYV